MGATASSFGIANGIAGEGEYWSLDARNNNFWPQDSDSEERVGLLSTPPRTRDTQSRKSLRVSALDDNGNWTEGRVMTAIVAETNFGASQETMMIPSTSGAFPALSSPKILRTHSERTSFTAAPPRPQRRNSFRTPKWTQRRRLLIQDSWALIVQRYGKSEPGRLIFAHIFRFAPQLRLVFKVPSDWRKTDEHSNFARHTGVFANVIDLAVRNIFELERELGPLMATLGARHASKATGFDARLLPAFAKGIVSFVTTELEEEEDGEVALAWGLLTDFMSQGLKTGFETQRKRVLRHQRSVDSLG